jgi:hypothetical protein
MLFNGKYPFLNNDEHYDIPRAFKDILGKELVIPSHPKRSNELVELCKRML